MSINDALVIGLLQGFLEWLPVSSKSMVMLYLVNVAASRGETAYLTALILHVSTATAALVMFRSNYRQILRYLFRRPKVDDGEAAALLRGLIGATGISAALGLPLYYLAGEHVLEFGGLMLTAIIGLLLTVTGFALRFSSRLSGFRNVGDLRLGDILLAGVAQGLSALPGLSRSGLVASSLLLRDFDRRAALRFTFIISVPAIYGLAAADLLVGLGLFRSSLADLGLVNLFSASAMSFAVSLLSLRMMLGWAAKLNFSSFLLSFGGLTFCLAAVFSFLS